MLELRKELALTNLIIEYAWMEKYAQAIWFFITTSPKVPSAHLVDLRILKNWVKLENYLAVLKLRLPELAIRQPNCQVIASLEQVVLTFTSFTSYRISFNPYNCGTCQWDHFKQSKYLTYYDINFFVVQVWLTLIFGKSK